MIRIEKLLLCLLLLVSLSISQLAVAEQIQGARPNLSENQHYYCPEVVDDPAFTDSLADTGVYLSIAEPEGATEPLPVLVFFPGYLANFHLRNSTLPGVNQHN